jgi:hypothetical protein
LPPFGAWRPRNRWARAWKKKRPENGGPNPHRGTNIRAYDRVRSVFGSGFPLCLAPNSPNPWRYSLFSA